MGLKGGFLPSSNSMWMLWVQWGGSSVASLSTKVSKKSWYLDGTLMAINLREDCEGLVIRVGDEGSGDMDTQTEVDREQGAGM